MINPKDVAKMNTVKGRANLPEELVIEMTNNKGDDEESKEEEE